MCECLYQKELQRIHEEIQEERDYCMKIYNEQPEDTKRYLHYSGIVTALDIVLTIINESGEGND
jgi:hypothetical protein